MIEKFTPSTPLNAQMWIVYSGNVRMASCVGMVSDVKPKTVMVKQLVNKADNSCKVLCDAKLVRKDAIAWVCSSRGEAEAIVSMNWEIYEERKRLISEAEGKAREYAEMRINGLMVEFNGVKI